MIEIEGLKKTFPGGTQAVRGVDLRVEAGELLALLGPNGAGKTTTIRACTTLSGFDDGRIRVAGHDVDTDPQEVRRAIGYVAQSTGVDFFLTGRENLVLQGRLYRMDKDEIRRRVEELAAQLELTEALDRPVSEYSGGMQRKLDIATALIHHPRVLFLDEPTLGLDTASRRALWQHIRRLNGEQDLTILLTTHYLEEADALAHRVAIMHQGEVKVVDRPEALKAQLGGDAVTVEFPPETDPGAFQEAAAQRLEVRRQVREGRRLHLYLPDGGQAIPALMALAQELGLAVEAVTLSRPSLDDVFLHYTGASLKGDGEEDGGEPWWAKWAGKGGGRWQKQWQSAEGEGTGESSDWQAWQSQGGEGPPSQAGGSETPSQPPEDWRRWQAGGTGAPGAGETAWPGKGDDSASADGSGNRWSHGEGGAGGAAWGGPGKDQEKDKGEGR